MSLAFLQVFQGIATLFAEQPLVAAVRLLLIGSGLLLCYLGYRKTLEPLLMVPMGLGMVTVNAGVLLLDGGRTGTLFLDPLVNEPTQLLDALQINFLQPIYNLTFSNGLIACLIFLSIGAMTDLDYLIARPMASMLMALSAELGTVVALPLAVLLGFNLKEAASIAMIGGADGPLVLYTSLMLARDLFVPIAVVGYLYLSLIYAGYPYLIKLLVPKHARGVEMDPRAIPEVSRAQKFTFAVASAAILSLLFPPAAPLFASFFLGVAIKEASITRYLEFLEGPLLYGSTLFLGFVLGALLSANVVLNPRVLLLLLLGMVALLFSGIGGIAGGLLAYKLSKGKFNPLLGIAGVSCIPTCAKVAQKSAFEANKRVMILPHAMGPQVAGVITSATFAGVYLVLAPLFS